MEFRIDAGLPEAMATTLVKAIGKRPLEYDALGRLAFSFPPPFQHLQIADGETLTPAKRVELAAALVFFDPESGLFHPA